MHGVTTALVAFIFFCVIFPERVKNRPQFYAAFGLICAIILLDAVSFMLLGLESRSFRVFAYFAIAFLQVGAMLLLFMAAGGLSWQDLKGEMGRAYEVIRRGSEEKEVIIPLSGQKPKTRDTPDDADDETTPVVRIDPPAPNPPRSTDDPSEKIPLE
jgi:hypothetical protein